MAFNLPPPPTSNDPKDPAFRDWFYKLQKAFSTVGSYLFTNLDFTGSDITSIVTRNHADLQNLNTASYTHLTSTQATDLTDGGATTLHTHDHTTLTNLNSTTYTHLTNNEYIGAKNTMSTALLSDAALVINADPTKFNVPAFTARFLNNYTNILNPTFNILSYAGSTGHSVTNLTTTDATFISLDKDGNIYQSATQLTPAQSRDRVEIGALVHSSRTQIDSVTIFTETVGIDVAASINDFSLSIGPINRTGNEFSGNPTSTLKINKSAGETFQVGLNWSVSKQSPNVTTDAALTAPNFFYSWRNGSGNFNVVITDTVNPGRYDDGTGGAGQPNGVVTPNRWQLVKLYRQQAANANGVALEYGQATYGSKAAAIAAKANATVVNPAIATLQFRGWLVVRGGATDLTDTGDAEFINVGAFSSPINAGGVGGGTTTLQGAYNNSVTPQITTTATLGSVDFKRGSASDTDDVLRILTGGGLESASLSGTGIISGRVKVYEPSVVSGFFTNVTYTASEPKLPEFVTDSNGDIVTAWGGSYTSGPLD